MNGDRALSARRIGPRMKKATDSTFRGCCGGLRPPHRVRPSPLARLIVSAVRGARREGSFRPRTTDQTAPRPPATLFSSARRTGQSGLSIWHLIGATRNRGATPATLNTAARASCLCRVIPTEAGKGEGCGMSWHNPSTTTLDRLVYSVLTVERPSRRRSTCRRRGVVVRHRAPRRMPGRVGLLIRRASLA